METESILQFSEKDLFKLFINVETTLLSKTNKLLFKPQKQDYYDKINEYLPQQSHITFSNPNYDLQTILRKFKRKKQTKVNRTLIIESASSEIVLSLDLPDTNASVSAGGDGPSVPKKAKGPETFSASISTSYKDFDSLSDARKRVITQPLIDMLETFLKVGEFSLDVNQLLGYLLCRENGSKKKSYAYKSGCFLYRQEVEKLALFSPLEAVSLMHTLCLSKQDMRCMRQFLLMKDIDFPCTNDLLEVRKSIRPESKAVLNNKGRSVDYKELVSMTANSIVSVVQEEDQDFIPYKLTILKMGAMVQAACQNSNLYRQLRIRSTFFSMELFL